MDKLTPRQDIAVSRYLKNMEYEQSIVLDATGHINGQGLSPINEMIFGLSSAGEAACEAIAVYNVLNDQGISIPLSDIIFADEVNHYMWFDGILGTLPKRVDDLLSLYGVKYTEMTLEEVRQKADDGEYADGQTFVAIIWNNKKNPFDGIHTFEIEYSLGNENAVTWDTYNRYKFADTVRGYESIDDILHNKDIMGKYIFIYQIDGGTH